MSENDAIAYEGVITENSGHGFFRVRVSSPGLMENRDVRCQSSGRMRKNNIAITTGDRVRLDITPYDLAIGRITYRL